MATAVYLKPGNVSLNQAEQLLMLYAAVGLSVEASTHLPGLGGGSQDCGELWWHSMFEKDVAVGISHARTKPNEERLRKPYFAHHQDESQIPFAPAAKRMISCNLI